MSKENRPFPKVLFINPYYGKWPEWFPAFLYSCKHNPKFTWLIPTDCGIPKDSPENVIFIESSMNELSSRATKKLGFDIPLTRPYKVNDLRPAFGQIYDDYLDGYDFWGHCDIDMIWGNIENFIDRTILENHDVIAARKNNICGHFTLYRNNPTINSLYLEHPLYKKAFISNTSYYFDEVGMTEVLNKTGKVDKSRVYWPKFLFNYPYEVKHGPSIVPKILNRWHWKDGYLLEESENGGEVMYLHFMTWKKTFRYMFVDFSADPDEFYISYTHVSQKKSHLPATFCGIEVHKLLPSFFV
jgi:hypothetical protein